MKNNELQCLLVSHYHLPWGSADRVFHFLQQEKNITTTFIKHPLLKNSFQQSTFIQPTKTLVKKRIYIPIIRHFTNFLLTNDWDIDTPDIAIGFDALSAYALYQKYRFLPTKVVLYLVDWTNGSAINRVNRLVAGLVDEVWGVSTSIKEKMHPFSVQVVPNIPLQFPLAVRNADKLRLGFIGHLTEEQNLMPFLEAMLHVKELDVELTIAGDGPQLSYYLQFQEEHHLNKVCFLGSLTTEEELIRFFISFDYGIFAYQETKDEKIVNGDSIKLVDYMANQKFVISTYRHPSIQKNQGVFVSPHPKEIADLLVKLLQNQPPISVINEFILQRYDILRHALRK